MSRKSIHTTGEHTIDNIVQSEYGQLSPEEHVEKKKYLAKLNPHIVSLESLRVGDQVFLEDEAPQDEAPQDEAPQDEGYSGIQENADDTPVDGTIHLPAVEKKKRH